MRVMLDYNSESAATLEAESGYTMESPQVSEFRQYVLDGMWDTAEDLLITLGVSEPDNHAVRIIFCAPL